MIGVFLFFYGAVLSISSTCTFHVAQGKGTDPSEVTALKHIKSSLVDPMDHLKSWNDGDPCISNWIGVFCNTSDDEYQHIHTLQLLNLNLSGTLASELGLLSHLEVLLLNGNCLSGSLPEEIGNLPHLDRLQIDLNEVSGPIPKSFANLSKIKHLHMNNNSLSGQIPTELSRLPELYHLLLDNNNLSGYLPPELASIPKLKILQLDNNNFSGTSIPTSYSNMATLVKLSLRNCSLQGTIPDLSRIHHLGYLDLSLNQLIGPVPSNLSINITTIDLSHNLLNGTIPLYSGFHKLQLLSLENNKLVGSVPSSVWQNITFNGNNSLILDFQNNFLTHIPDAYNPPANVTVLLYGNAVCANASQLSVVHFCQPNITSQISGSSTKSENICLSCPVDGQNSSASMQCTCAVPFGVGFRLKSPGISDFIPYINDFEIHLTRLLKLFPDQLYIDSFHWESGPRLHMKLKLFPSNSYYFNQSEILRLGRTLSSWDITLSDVYGPYELLDFTGPRANTSKSGLSKGALAGMLLGVIVGAAAISVTVTVLVMRRRHGYQSISRKRSSLRASIKISGVKCFAFEEMVLATRNFCHSTQVGQGGYGKVYKGTLDDGTIVAIKRAQEGSLQGSKEFSTEIEFLSRLHHRNLVSLLGYCDERDEQMLVYEFMPNGTLRDHLSAKRKEPLSFSKRLHIALGSARGILYLHTEADPPIFHRDIKASNILLDFKFLAKVADFGLSRLAPIPDTEGIVPGHISTVVKGTPGYLDPEYVLTHQLTDKSDVYSLGVVFLELLTGMRPISHGKNIVREVRTALQSGLMFSIIDSGMGYYPSECMEKFVSLAVRCCCDETDARPSMAEVVQELESISHMMSENSTSEYVITDSSQIISNSSMSLDHSSSVNIVDSGSVMAR
ncbi:putative LRR receptor-like serine/threonine-protein kinase [Canna indica]|uniref:non-specific serine/threonine protein kinase n=1 Tax=Canna indica TaxID=4628 RepID=A0AAQ3JX07_9LILI|nr:putative LRR receptor-like serine/threonine-protein kinase [Canna indica]